MELTMRRRLAAVILAVLMGVVAAACSSSGSSRDSTKTSGDTKAKAQLPDKITIGYQQVPNGDLVVKHEGWLEKALPGVSIEWKLFDSGGSVNQAVLAGAVDLGLVGSSPASRGISTGIPYQVPWIFDVIGKAESLVVKPGISSIKDLKGKTIATPFASTSHFSLLAALDDAGVSQSDVKIIDAEPDAIFAAWTRGDIDGAYVWNPNLAKLIQDGGKVLVTSADLAKKGKTTYDLAVVTNEFASKYPDAVQKWIDVENRAVGLIRDDVGAASKDVAAELNITPAEAKSQLGDLVFVDAKTQAGADYLGGGLAKNLYEAALFNKQLGEIPSTRPEKAYQDAVTATFAAKAKSGS